MPAELPIIVRVFGDGAPTDVPVTPETTSSDVIQCCRDPGDENCDLIAFCPDKGECALRQTDHPLEILQRWGSGRLVLRYTMLSTNGGTFETRNGMKEPEPFNEPLPADGVHLSLIELRAMACRQQTQIDSQQQMLAAKEQRLRWLKEQEVRQQRVHAESERLRRLRDRVDAQELKLRKLRALRGQVDNQKQSNISLTSDLDSIRALFNEKEKELSMAVAKVDELTRQLEELRRGRSAAAAASRDPPPASALELDKLRRELMYRNKLNEQQNLRLSQQREALTARQEEMSAIDKRISELQERLHRKRTLNQQLANQISATSQKAAYHQLVRLTGGSTDQTTPTSHPHYPNHPPHHIQQQHQQPSSRKPNSHPSHHQQHQNSPPMNTMGFNGAGNNLLHQLAAASYNNSSTIASMLQRGNIAAVEPYNHIPAPQPRQPGQPTLQSNNNPGQLEVLGMSMSTQAQNIQHLQQMQQQQHSPNMNGGSGGNSAKGSPLMTHQGQSHQDYQLNLQQQQQQQKAYSNLNQNYQQPSKEDVQKFNNHLPEDHDDLFKQQQQQQHLSKSDPKYQTLPYNTKFTVNLLTSTTGKDQQNNNSGLPSKESPTNSYQQQQQNYSYTLQQQKELPKDPSPTSNQQPNLLNLNNIGRDVVDLNGNSSRSKNVMAISNVLQIAEQISGGGLLKCAVTIPGGGTSISNQQHQQQQKPITATSSVNKLSANLYQTSSSTKVQPVEPQTSQTTSHHHQIVQNSILNTINATLINSVPPPLPPQSSNTVSAAASTVLMSVGLPTSITNSNTSSNIASIISSINNNNNTVNTTQVIVISPKPALPPKPSPPQSFTGGANSNNAIKLPPRQTMVPSQQQEQQQRVVTGEESSTTTTTTKDVSPPPPPPLTQPPPDDDVAISPPSPQQLRPPPPPKIPSTTTTSNNQQQNLTVTSSPTISSNIITTISSSLSTSAIPSPLSPSSLSSTVNNNSNVNVIKAKPLTLRKQLLQSEQPKLRTTSSRLNGLIAANSMQHKKHHQQQQHQTAVVVTNDLPSSISSSGGEVAVAADLNSDKQQQQQQLSSDDSSSVTSSEIGSSGSNGVRLRHPPVGGATKKGNLKNKASANGGSRRVSFDPLALLLDASLEGELELVKKTATQVANPSAANDEGITALHNAICAGHLEIVRFLVGYGCDVNAPDSDGWTPLHCAASCNNVAMVRFLVERGACIFAATLSDRETAAEKCEEDEEGFDGCSEYLYSVQEKLGILSNGAVYAVFDYVAQNQDELGFHAGQQLTVLRKGDETEREWWWCRLDDKEGYVPRNLLGLYPRVVPSTSTEEITY